MPDSWAPGAGAGVRRAVGASNADRRGVSILAVALGADRDAIFGAALFAVVRMAFALIFFGACFVLFSSMAGVGAGRDAVFGGGRCFCLWGSGFFGDGWGWPCEAPTKVRLIGARRVSMGAGSAGRKTDMAAATTAWVKMEINNPMMIGPFVFVMSDYRALAGFCDGVRVAGYFAIVTGCWKTLLDFYHPAMRFVVVKKPSASFHLTIMLRVPITLENETTTPVETMKDRYRISSRLLTNR